jgi:Ca2+:H+ antiporter
VRAGRAAGTMPAMTGSTQADTAVESGPTFIRSDQIIIGAAVGGIVLSAIATYAHLPEVLAFAVTAVTVAMLAALVGRSVEQLGDRFGPGATGVLQSALGNLPELFIGIFALRAGLTQVVQAAIIGSLIGNALLVLGLAFLVGGLKHGTQRFDSKLARDTAALGVLALAALVVPSLASYVHTPAADHEGTLSIIVSVVLLAVFALSLPAALRRKAPEEASPGLASDGAAPVAPPRHMEVPRWPIGLAIGLLAAASGAAAFVSDWFVEALTPAMDSLGVSQVFAGLVVVAIAGNAIENVVGIQLAYRNQPDYAFSVIINSPLQVSLVLAPALVLLSHVVGGAVLTLVFTPMLVAAVALTIIAVAFITIDGESNWLEGTAMLGLYAVIAASFWWG